MIKKIGIRIVDHSLVFGYIAILKWYDFIYLHHISVIIAHLLQVTPYTH